MREKLNCTPKRCVQNAKSWHRPNAPYALPAKVVSALIAVDLFVTGCTGQVSPTISPTEVNPAITAPLPSSVPTEIPTPTPTTLPTAIADAMGGSFPGSITERILSDAVLAKQHTDFDALQQAKPDVKKETQLMETRLREIGGTPVTTDALVDGARWGVIPAIDGKPCILQKTTDGGKTWVNVVDASAYSELVANADFDATHYRLIPLNRPEGVPETATAEVMSQGGWMIHVWKNQTGTILAWYDAANDQYLTLDGKKLEVHQNYSFKPLTEMTRWEDCVAPEQQLPWIDDPEFERAWKALKTNDSKFKTPDLFVPGLTIFTLNFPSDDIYNFPITGPYGWNTSSLAQGGYGLVDTCGTLATPDGKHLNFVRVAIKMVPNVLRDDLGSSYIHLTFVVDQELLKKNWTKDPRGVYMPDEQPIEVQFHALQTLGDISIIPFTKDQPIGNEELTNPDTRDIAALIQRNQKEGIQEILIRALQAQATTEELLYLQEHAIIPVDYIVVSY